jgi:hypothetical protein
MVSLNELCDSAAPLNTSLRQACALPRSPADMTPLPEPHTDIAFDSSWEALLVDTASVGKPAD